MKMIWTHRGKPIRLEVSMVFRRGWYAAQIIAEHARPDGKYNIDGPKASTTHAPIAVESCEI